MNNNIVYIVLMIILAIFLILLANNKENLSLSQFPIPTCSTCKSCTFYTNSGCGTLYQEQNKIGQATCAGGFTVYPTKLSPSCYSQTLKGGPEVGSVMTCNETFSGASNGANIGFKKLSEQEFNGNDSGDCPKIVYPKSSCSSCNGDYTCLEPGSTFDSGSTMARNLPCPAPFPPVLPGFEPIMHKQLMHTSELDIFNHLNHGDLLIAANKGDTISYVMKKLQEHTLSNSRKGYPDFYYIEGPILVMSKVGNNYYWMVDYPIKYTPENFKNYVNTSDNWNIAKTAYNAGIKLLNKNAPVIFFAADSNVHQKLRAAAVKCLPVGQPQSNTDYYYPGCADKSCLWGPKYGSGNWLTRV